MKAKNSTIAKVMGNTAKTIENWKREKRIIIDIIDLYYDEESLQEFIDFGRISKYDSRNSEDLKMNAFFFSNAVFKIRQRSELPLYEVQMNDILKLFTDIGKAIINKNIHKEVFPLHSFLKIIENRNVVDVESFYNQLDIEKLKIENFKKIIKNFCKNEMSSQELLQIITDKKNLVRIFTEYKNDKNSILNWR